MEAGSVIRQAFVALLLLPLAPAAVHAQERDDAVAAYQLHSKFEEEARRADGFEARCALYRKYEPRFLELRTYRFRAHSMYDAELYRTKEEVEKHKKHDPIEGFQDRLLAEGLIEQADIDAIEADAAKEIADAVEFAEQGEWEPIEDITRHVYARDLS